MTISQRSKEEAADYRYFPEPDIPPFIWKKSYIESLKEELPELPDAKMKRFIGNYNLSDYNVEILTRDRETADFFEESVKAGWEYQVEPKIIANWMINKKIDTTSLLPAQLIEQIVKENKIEGIDEKELEKVLNDVLTAHPKAVTEYKSGKTTVIMFLVGQAMKELKGKVKAEIVKEKILEIL